MSTPPPGSVKELERLLKRKTPLVVVATTEELEALQAVAAWAMRKRAGGEHCFTWSASRGLGPLLELSAAADEKTRDLGAALDAVAARKHAGLVLVLCDPAASLVQEPRAARLLRDLLWRCEEGEGTLVLLEPQPERLPPAVLAHAKRWAPALPDEGEIRALLGERMRELSEAGILKVDIHRSRFEAILRNLRGLNRRQLRRVVDDDLFSDGQLCDLDVHRVIEAKRRALGGDGLLEVIEPVASLQEVGGMQRLKQWVGERRSLHKMPAEWKLPPARGVLLLGVPGSGKSLCARAIATALGMPLLRLDPGILYDRYIGESERRLRDALRQVEAMAPVVLWVDEIEKGFAGAASHSVDGGLSNRMFGSLLTWMQDRRQPVFLVATANNIAALPPELLRKGRFDEVFFVDLPSAAVREQILSIHLRAHGQDPDAFDLAATALAAEGRSGAELQQAVQAMLYTAANTGRAPDAALLRETLLASPPLSVTMAEQIAALRAWAAGRALPVD